MEALTNATVVTCNPDGCRCGASDCSWRRFAANKSGRAFIGPLRRMEFPLPSKSWRFVVEEISVPGFGPYLVSTQNSTGHRSPVGPVDRRGDQVFDEYERAVRSFS